MRTKTIAGWSENTLSRFVQTVVHSLPVPAALETDEIRATRKLTVDQELALGSEAIAYLKQQLGL